MASDLNGKNNIEKLVNELIKSPKQVRPILTQCIVSDCIQVKPFTFLDGAVEEVIFTNVSFINDFSLLSITGNKLIIIENCIFHAAMELRCLKDAKIIIRNCTFRETPIIKAKRSQLSDTNNTIPVGSRAGILTPDTSFSSAIALLDTIILN